MKNKKVNLIVAILVIVGIVFGIIKLLSSKDDEKHKLAAIYNQLNTNQTYLFEMKQDDNNKTIMAQKGDKTIIDQYSKDSHLTTIVKDNSTYLVLHDREEYYVYEPNNVKQSILIDGIKDVIDREYTTGTEKVRGKKYSYEEYNGSTTFMNANVGDYNESDIKTRFYFDKNDNLVFVKTINGTNLELQEVKLETEVDDSIFEIPSNYAEN